VRITVAGEGCCPFFFPVAMTRPGDVAQAHRLAAQVQRGGEHRLVGDCRAADRLAPGAGRLVALQGPVADVGMTDREAPTQGRLAAEPVAPAMTGARQDTTRAGALAPRYASGRSQVTAD
jgi:hypothetical protein